MDSKKSKRSRGKGMSKKNTARGGRDTDPRAQSRPGTKRESKDTPQPLVENLSESSDSIKKKANNLKELKELESEDDSILGDTTKKVHLNSNSPSKKKIRKQSPVRQLNIQVKKDETSLENKLNDTETPLRKEKL